MFDRYMIVGEEFRNVSKDGEITGFQVGARLPYYRGIVVSIIKTIDLAVDGEHIPPEKISVTLRGQTYPLMAFKSMPEFRWEFGEVGILTVEKPGGLTPGEHKFDLFIHLDISYMSGRGFSGSDHKDLSLAA